ncbi:hypothetical protein D3C79_899390 [compost metagenome]
MAVRSNIPPIAATMTILKIMANHKGRFAFTSEILINAPNIANSPCAKLRIPVTL